MHEQLFSCSVKLTASQVRFDLIVNSCGRRGEEHSFILKPATSLWKNVKATGEKSTRSHLPAVNAASSLRLPPTVEGKSVSSAGQYSIMVSCRCNYTGNVFY